MKLVRNQTADGTGKYSVTRNRDGKVLDSHPGSHEEFFVLMLKDEYSKPALQAYADAVRAFDPEYAAEIDEMAARSGVDHPAAKKPD